MKILERLVLNYKKILKGFKPEFNTDFIPNTKPKQETITFYTSERRKRLSAASQTLPKLRNSYFNILTTP